MTQQAEATKNALVFGAAVTAFLVLLLGGSAWVDFLITDARNAEACRTAWDSRYQPQYAASKCSIMQRGYRVPEPDYVDLSDIRSPDAGDY